MISLAEMYKCIFPAITAEVFKINVNCNNAGSPKNFSFPLSNFCVASHYKDITKYLLTIKTLAMAQTKSLTPSSLLTRTSKSQFIGRIAYWIFTVLVAWEMALGAYWDLFQTSYVRDVFSHLHLPSYFLIIMGIWKLPCAVILLIPRSPRVKEWAYAGAFFNYSGAVVLHISANDGLGGWAAPALYALFTVASWALRSPSRKMVVTNNPVEQSEKPKKGKLIGYWIVTSLLAFVVISGGVAEWTDFTKTTVKGMLLLGYPVYFTRLLGFWKIAGGIVLLAPRFRLVKEWAYAGIFFNMTGAFLTHIACHSAPFHLVWTGAFSVLTVVSWALRPDDRKWT
jgi:hypothetical protein